MAKINIIIPEPNPQYIVDNQRQTKYGLDTLVTQLNTSFQVDLKNEQDAFNWFLQ